MRRTSRESAASSNPRTLAPLIRRRFALAAFLLTASLPVQAAPAMPGIHATAGPAFELPADADPETVPLRWADGRVFLQASINGQNAGWFLVSTGIPVSSICSSAARNLDLTAISSSLRAPLNPAPRQFYRADVLRIGGASASDVVLQEVDYPKMSKMLTDMYGEGVAGELSWDLLKTLPFILDEPGLQFRWQRKAVPGSDAVRMPLSDPKGVPMIEIKLGGTCTVPALLGSAWASATALLEAGAPVNPPPGQSLPLAETVWDPKLVRLLFNKGADPNRANDLGATPLMAAAGSGVPGAVEMLGPNLRLPKDLKDVAPVFSIAIYGQTPAVAMDMLKRIPKESLAGLKWPAMLETTLWLGYADSADWVLATGGPKLAREGGQLQPLLAAILPTRVGKSDAVRLKLVTRLLAAGADPNAGRKGVGPLLLAARYGSGDIVKALLAGGAKATATDHQGRHALHRAAAANQAVEVIAPLIKPGLDLDDVDPVTDLSPLATYAMHGNIKACAALLEAGAKADVESMFSPSPLAMAAHSPDTPEEDALAVARLLLEHGAKPGANPVNETVPPPLYGAILNSRASLIQPLVAAGAPVEMKIEDGTPLGWACAAADTATVKTLLDLGADPKVLDQRGVSPLARAAAEGKTDNMAYLMNRGVPADGGNSQAVSPLWLAVSCGQIRAVRLLLAAGANLDTRDPVRKTTPLEAARSRRDQVMVDLLENAVRKR